MKWLILKATLYVNRELLHEAMELGGLKGFTETIEVALKEFVRRKRLEKLAASLSKTDLALDDRFLPALYSARPTSSGASWMLALRVLRVNCTGGCPCFWCTRSQNGASAFGGDGPGLCRARTQGACAVGGWLWRCSGQLPPLLLIFHEPLDNQLVCSYNYSNTINIRIKIVRECYSCKKSILLAPVS